MMPIRNAQPADLPCIVKIYNAAIPSHQAAADAAPVTVASREPWFREFDPERHPLWVLERAAAICGGLCLRSLYGRPAYQATVEAAVYTAPELPRVAELDGVEGDVLILGLRTG
jgi:L-amino acid N-acyltransferase YncA